MLSRCLQKMKKNANNKKNYSLDIRLEFDIQMCGHLMSLREINKNNG